MTISGAHVHRAGPLPFAAAILLASIFAARQTQAGDLHEADAGLNRGVVAMQAGDYRAALEAFKSADTINPTPHSEAEIGLAEQALGAWVTAEAFLADALKAVDDPWISRNRAILQGARDAARAHVGELTVTVEPTGLSFFLHINGQFRLPDRPARVPEGHVLVEVDAAGYQPATRTINVAGGGAASVLISLKPLIPQKLAAPLTATDIASPTPTTSPQSHVRSAVGILLLGTGLASGAVGGYFLSLDGSSTCDGSQPVCPTRYATKAEGGLLVGASAAIAAFGLVLLSR